MAKTYRENGWDEVNTALHALCKSESLWIIKQQSFTPRYHLKDKDKCVNSIDILLAAETSSNAHEDLKISFEDSHDDYDDDSHWKTIIPWMANRFWGNSGEQFPKKAQMLRAKKEVEERRYHQLRLPMKKNVRRSRSQGDCGNTTI